MLDGRLGVRARRRRGDRRGRGRTCCKPRGQWHTVWNAGDTPLRFIELLVPGGVDRYFQQISSMLRAARQPDADAIQRMSAEYGIEFNFRSVPSLCERFGLRFG